MTHSQTSSATGHDVTSGDTTSKSLPSSPSKLDSGSWDKSQTIVEEKGEDVGGGEVKGVDVEKGTELTENFNVETQLAVDR